MHFTWIVAIFANILNQSLTDTTKERDEQILESEKDKAWAEYLKSKNKPTAEKVISILKTFDEHIANLRATDLVGTATNYNSTRNKIAAFINNKEVPINEINVQWLKAFDASMVRKKLAVNTKYKHMKHLRKLLGWPIGKVLFWSYLSNASL